MKEGTLAGMRIGAHVSSAGGLHRAFEKARALGAEAMQVFLTAPQQWRLPQLNEEQLAAFRAAKEEAGIPVFIHGVYLVNLGSQDEAILAKSVESLKAYLRYTSLLGAEATIFHVGSHLGAGFDAVSAQVCRLIEEVLRDTPDDARLLLENNAGQGNCIGARFGELAAILRGLGNPARLGVCFDTCHAFAMGYDIASEAGCLRAMEEFDRELGNARLLAVHANDSKGPLGSIRDRHENIGDGAIGYDGFRTILRHPAFANASFVLEVPGIDGKGPDVENVERLKRLRAEVQGS